MARKKITYIISHVHKSFAFEWIAKGLENDYEFYFILLNPAGSYFEQFLIDEHFAFKRINYRNKFDFPLALLKVFFILLFKRPDIVHVHLLDAQLIGLTAAKLAGIRKRIYTRHTSNFHHAYSPSGIKYDRWSNLLATKIISISQATDRTLIDIEKVLPKKIVKIPHGFDWKYFNNISIDRIEKVRSFWKIQNKSIVIGVIARHIEWKGIQYIIPAFREFLSKHPDSVLILANAGGPYHETILEMIMDLPAGKIIMIPFEEDVAALYRVFDMYVHTPIDSICEAFGQTYVEALALDIPSIFTLSGIAAEFIKNHENALIVPFKDSLAISDSLARIYADSELRSKLIENGKRDVISRFGIDAMLGSLKMVYDE